RRRHAGPLEESLVLEEPVLVGANGLAALVEDDLLVLRQFLDLLWQEQGALLLVVADRYLVAVAPTAAAAAFLLPAHRLVAEHFAVFVGVGLFARGEHDLRAVVGDEVLRVVVAVGRAQLR